MDGQQLSDRAAAAYLEHLGVDAAPGEVDAATLTAVARAHVGRVPYENIDIYRGAPPGIEPYVNSADELVDVGWWTIADLEADPRCPSWLPTLIRRAAVAS